jgi:hypothetical protein
LLPRVIVRVRKAVRRLARRDGDEAVLSGAENEARWHAMIYRIGERDREAEHRLAQAEQALNRLNLN